MTSGMNFSVHDFKMLRSLFESSPDAVLLIEADGRIALVNRQTEAILGYGRDELQGQPVEVLVPERLRGRHVDLRQRFTANPSLRPMGAGSSLVARRKDGSELPVDIMLSPIKAKDQATRTIVALRDATARVRTEEQLTASEAVFKALFDQAPDAIVAVDLNGKIVRVNHQTETMLGYAPSELLGQPIEMLVPDRYRTEHVGKRQAYTSCPVSRPMGAGLELSARRRDGSEVPVDIMLSPVQLKDSGMVISVLRDITEKRQAAQALKERAAQLESSNKELEMFAYVASHDLQEPLRAVASSCQLLEKRLGDKLEPTNREFLQFAVDGAKRMRALIDDLLAFSRVSSRSAEPSPVSLDETLRRALANLGTRIAETSAAIKSDPLPAVLGDAGQLVQVFQNLIGNALKFHREDVQARIDVTCERQGAFYKIAIKDNGIGMEPRYHEKIFVLFQRLHTRDEYPGTGIGLALCKKIIERHGGTIHVESEPGRGSTFSFLLRPAP